MKTNVFLLPRKLFFYLFLMVYTVSCINEEGLHPQKDQYIKNEGYLPLAPDNTWVYETWFANYNKETGTYTYEPNSILSQTSISGISVDNVNNQIQYKFSPFADSFLGGLLGNFEKVTFKDNKYYRNADIDLLSGGTDVSFNILSGVFLKEDAKIGDLLYSKSDSVRSNIGTKVNIKYKINTYVTGKYDKMPDHLSRTSGVDEQLKEYKDIVQITDSITIEKIEFELNNINVNFSVTAEIIGGKGKANISTQGRLGGIALASIFPYTLGLPLVFNIEQLIEGLLNASFSPDIDAICPLTGTISINEIISQRFDLVTNDTPIYIDSYYAKNIGKIKSITNIDQVKGVIEADNFRNNPYKIMIQLKDKDPNCSNKCKDNPDPKCKPKNTVTMNLNVEAILDGLFISIPISGGLKSDIIQNLKHYSLRKTLN